MKQHLPKVAIAILALAASAIVREGASMAVVRMPVIDELTLYQLRKGSAWVLVICSVLTGIALAFRLNKWIPLATYLAAVGAGVHLWRTLANKLDDLRRSLAENPMFEGQDELVDTMMSETEVQSGTWWLASGMGMLFLLLVLTLLIKRPTEN